MAISKNKTRKDKTDNAIIIRDFVLKYLDDNIGKKIPTYKEIAQGTGLHFNTVWKHYQNLKFEKKDTALNALTENVIANLFNLTRRQTAAVKLWFQYMEGWVEKQEITDPNHRESDPNFDNLSHEELLAAMKDLGYDRAK